MEINSTRVPKRAIGIYDGWHTLAKSRIPATAAADRSAQRENDKELNFTKFADLARIYVHRRRNEFSRGTSQDVRIDDNHCIEGFVENLNFFNTYTVKRFSLPT